MDNLKNKQVPDAGKPGHVARHAVASRGEASLVLDFFGTFCIKAKSGK